MRRKIADRVKWLEDNWVTKDGHRWSLKGREWVMEEIIRPLYGWRISSAAEGDDVLCKRCTKFAGRIVEWSSELEDVIERDHASGHDGACAGLFLRKIQVVVVCVNRRGGKTTNVCAVSGEMIAHDPWIDMMMFASAGAQTETLFRENLLQPLQTIEDEGGDIEEFEATRDRVVFPELHSQFEIVDSSRRSVTGRGKNRLIVEEARDVDGTLFVKSLPSILDRNFLTCPNGHRFPFEVEDARQRRKRCPTCTERLEPHFAAVLIVSSAGILDDSPDLKWFSELVTKLEEEPHPAFHLFRDDDVANPAIAEESRELMAVFEKVPSISDLMHAERTNAFSQKGDKFLSGPEYSRCLDPQLLHADGCADPCILFFDTSLKKDLLSLTCLAVDEGTAPFWARGPKASAVKPWSLVYVPSIFTWDPKEVFRAADGRIVKHEEVARDLLSPILPLFPNAREIWVDVRGQLWAHRFVELGAVSGQSWGRKLKKYQHGGKEQEVRRNGFTLLGQRVTGRTIRMFAHDRVKREIDGLIKKQDTQGNVDVVDRVRKLMHADVVSGLAALCERAWTLQVQRATAGDINRRMSPQMTNVLDRLRGPGRKLSPDSF